MSQPRKIIGKIARINIHTDSRIYIADLHPTDRIYDSKDGAYSKNVAARQTLLNIAEKKIEKVTLDIIEDNCISVGDIPQDFIYGYDAFYHVRSPYLINEVSCNNNIELDPSIDIMSILNRYIDMDLKDYPTKFSLNMTREEEIVNDLIITRNRIICVEIM